MKDLESYFVKYPDVPREAIVKADLLRLGVGIKGIPNAGRTDWYAITHEFRIQGGPYELRPTILQSNPPCRQACQTPYLVDFSLEKPALIKGPEKLAEVTPVQVPSYYLRTFPDGTPYCKIAPLTDGNRVVFILAFPDCQNWDYQQQCRFCDLHEYVDKERSLTRVYPLEVGILDVQRTASVLETIFLEGGQTYERAIAYIISGGAIRTEVNGLKEADFYLQYVQAIKERLGNRWPCTLVVRAQPEGDLKRLSAGGVDAVSHNLEVWDERLFKIICPGKTRTPGREEWIRRLLRAVDIFGEGNVHSTFVAGVEMAQPSGFDDVSEALASTLSGFNFLMSHGVIPKLCTWYIAPKSALAENIAPPLDYYIRVAQGWYELWKRHCLPPPTGLGPMGPGRSIWPSSNFLDMGS